MVERTPGARSFIGEAIAAFTRGASSQLRTTQPLRDILLELCYLLVALVSTLVDRTAQEEEQQPRLRGSQSLSPVEPGAARVTFDTRSRSLSPEGPKAYPSINSTIAVPSSSPATSSSSSSPQSAQPSAAPLPSYPYTSTREEEWRKWQQEERQAAQKRVSAAREQQPGNATRTATGSVSSTETGGARDFVQKGARYYAVLVAKPGEAPGLYKSFAKYSAVVGYPGKAPRGGQSATSADHLVFYEGSISHSFQSVEQAEAWLVREGWYSRYNYLLPRHW